MNGIQTLVKRIERTKNERTNERMMNIERWTTESDL